MLIKASSLDDALGRILRILLRDGAPIRTSRGQAREVTSVLVKLSDPRARLSRSEGRGILFSSIGETLWYLSGSDRLRQIKYYIPNYHKFIRASHRAVRAPGAYGPRLFRGGNDSQMMKLMEVLRKKIDSSDTRQAVAQIFDRSDLRPDNGDVPCTTTLQFLPRSGKLHMITTMRSNDAYLGLPSDVFAFTFIQELVSRTLDLEVGSYSHFVGSLHLYDSDVGKARKYVNEGFHTPISMPPMPKDDPWMSVEWLLAAEEAIRCGKAAPTSDNIDPYWRDLANLLKIYFYYKTDDKRSIVRIKQQMANREYEPYIRGKQNAMTHRDVSQSPLPGLFSNHN